MIKETVTTQLNNLQAGYLLMGLNTVVAVAKSRGCDSLELKLLYLKMEMIYLELGGEPETLRKDYKEN